MSTTTAKAAKTEGQDKNNLKNKTGYPAPKQLATPTDLKPDEVEKVVLALNPLIADAFALYVKTKNFHWHLASSQFREYHKLFDQQAKDIFESIDPMQSGCARLAVPPSAVFRISRLCRPLVMRTVIL